MKKFISVILAALMLVTVMPFAIFAADEEYKEPDNQAHACHPTKLDEDGKEVLDLTDLDMKALYEAGNITIAFDGAQDYNKPAYLVDGKNDTATRLSKGEKTVITVTSKDKALIDFATLKLVVNGKGTINGGSSYADKVTVDSKHDLKLKVEVYGLDDKGADKLVYSSVVKNDKGEVTQEFINTKDLTEVVLNVFEPGYKVVITTVGTAEAGKGGPRLWEIDATTVKGADAYVHTWIKEITKFPSLTEKGEYTQYCAICGTKDAEGETLNKYEIPMLTKETLTGGVVTVDDVKEYIEVTTKYETVDGKLVVAKDDDGNEIQMEKIVGSDPDALFDGKLGTGGGWWNGGNFYSGNTNAQLQIVFNKEITASTVELYIWMNWAQLSFDFYNGEDLVASMPKMTLELTEGWKDITSVDYVLDKDKETEKEIKVDLSGKTFDKIVITYDYSKGNCTKLGEIKIGTHVCVYDDSLAEFGEKVENDPCKYVFSKENASKVVCRECGKAAVTAEDGTITMDLHNYKETVDADGKVVYDYEYHKNAKKVDPTCGKDGSVTLTCLNSCENKESPVYAKYFKKVDGKDVPVYGKGNKQLLLGKDGNPYDEEDIKKDNAWDKIVIEKYNTKACGATVVKVLEATGDHKNAVSTVRVGKYPTCGADGIAYVICTDCKQRVDVKTVDDLLGMKLAADIVDANGVVVLKKNTTLTYKEDKEKPENTVDHIKQIKEMLLAQGKGIVVIDIAYSEENTNKAVTIRYTLQLNDEEELAVVSSTALANGYHTTAYKTVVPSTYTLAGLDCAYCTTCGTTFPEMTKAAELAVPVAKVRLIEFSLRTAEFEGVRGTFSLNNEVIKGMQAAGYNVRIFMVVTNEAGVSKEVQVYGAGAKAPVALDGRFHVVVKGGAADETFTFSYKVIVDDANGTAENVVEIASSSVADVKAAK